MTARIAVVGAGLIGRRHVEHVRAEAELAAVVDPVAPEADFRDVETMLRAKRPDAVIVATPNALHEAHALACIEAGVTVLVEKPLAEGVAAAARIVAAGEAAGVAVLVGHHRRHNPIVRAARRVIDEGRLGGIVAAHTTCWLAKPDDYFDVAWRREEGAGPILINLIHDVDLMRHYCGEVVAVQAMEAFGRGFAVEDTAVANLRFASGALGTISLSDRIAAPWSWELTAGENPAYPHTAEAATWLGGTKASLSVPNLALWRHEGAPSWWSEILREEIAAGAAVDPLALQVRHLADVALDGVSPLVSGREGLETLRVTEAIKTAARTGTAVTLQPNRESRRAAPRTDRPRAM